MNHRTLTMTNLLNLTHTTSGDLSTDVVSPSLKRTDDLPSDPSGEARELFNLGLVHALEYGVASADLKPSIPWARSRFHERKRLR